MKNRKGRHSASIEWIKSGTMIISDFYKVYVNLEKHGCLYKSVNHSDMMKGLIPKQIEGTGVRRRIRAHTIINKKNRGYFVLGPALKLAQRRIFYRDPCC